MSLAPGTRVGPYEILAPLGAGGMGEVYRARDTKLKRDVALKVLPESFASDPERMARFQREAEVLAALNHPNIAQIYGVEDRALVMELVEGEALAGPLPVETALNYARQIADALEAAHGKGITHRDLKPANIMITPAGVVKVLDFGLAAVAQSSAPSDPVNSPTLTISPTRAGMILGTAAYMSPEQARGKPVDKRADIWAFGVVLYEMLTGKPLFEGETVSDTLAAVLTKEPDWERVPEKVRRLLRRCLEKDNAKRLRDIGDAWELLDDAPFVAAPSRSRFGWVAAGAMALIAAGASWTAWRATRPVEHPLMRLSVDLGPDAVAGVNTTAVISPDGKRLVFLVRGADGKQQLATRLLEQAMPAVLPGTESATDPFFSPDGQWVGFFADSNLKKISIQGGAPVSLCDAVMPQGGSWGEDGNIIAVLNNAAGLSRIPEAGGTPEPLTKLDRGEGAHRWPQVIPGRDAVLFTVAPTNGAFEQASIELLSWKTGQRKVLVRGGYFGRYVPTTRTNGHLVYMHEGTLFDAPLDLARLELGGSPGPLLDDVAANPSMGTGQFDFSGTASGTGTLVYRRGTASSHGWPVVWLDSSGKTQPLLAKPGSYETPRLSPDGQRLALTVNTGKSSNVYLYDVRRDILSQLTFNGGDGAIWTPDGKRLAYSFGSGIWWIRADGAGEPQRLLEDNSQSAVFAYSFSPDGRRLAYMANDSQTRWDIWILPLDMSDPEHPKPGKQEPFLRTRFNELEPLFSPDGRWIAYRSTESGTYELYVRPSQNSPGAGGKWHVSNGTAQHPLWPRDGRQLFYQTADNHIMVADYTVQGDSFAASKPRLWSPTQILAPTGERNMDVTPDGKRFVVFPRPEVKEETESVHVTFLLNFFDELRLRAPAGGK